MFKVDRNINERKQERMVPRFVSRVRHSLLGFLSFCLSGSFSNGSVFTEQLQQAFAEECFLGRSCSACSGNWVGANRSSFMQRRKGTPSERELVERAPLGRAISKGLASLQLVHLSLALSMASRE